MKESSFIDQVMVVGEHEKFASALLVPDFKYLNEWCAARELTMGDKRDDIISLPEVIAAYNEEVSKINKSLSDWERISRFRIVTDDWSPASGELSASLKLKRKVVMEKYPELLDSIYRKQA
jgi:long-chain acyl-CoA synthetase